MLATQFKPELDMVVSVSEKVLQDKGFENIVPMIVPASSTLDGVDEVLFVLDKEGFKDKGYLGCQINESPCGEGYSFDFIKSDGTKTEDYSILLTVLFSENLHMIRFDGGSGSENKTIEEFLIDNWCLRV